MRRLVDLAIGALALGGLVAAQPSTSKIFMAQLTGANEVPANASGAKGHAQFKLTNDGLRYRLNVSGIENVVAAHIHIAPEGQNGPVVAFLYGPVEPRGGRSQGTLADGVIKAEDLTGPLAGATLAQLVSEIVDGHAYVNVHTNDGVEPPGTGPGDLPAGEIRGQIGAPGRREGDS